VVKKSKLERSNNRKKKQLKHMISYVSYPKITFTVIVLLGLFSICGNSKAADQYSNNTPPNIVFVFCDDLGFGDLGCYGNRIIKTPNLDRMAKEGLLFTNFTVSCCVCSPSRVGVMTGQFPSRLGFHGHVATVESNLRRGMPNYLDPDVATITKLFKSAGYATGHFGKWHMGGPHDKTAPPPEEYGIDLSATVCSNGTGFIKEGDTRAESSMRIMQHTMDFIEANTDKPFFINCWLIDPHAVLAPNEEQLARYPELESRAKGFTGATQVYNAVITDVDVQVGRLLDQLDRLGISENTLVVFSSDNGPSPIWGISTAHSGAGNVGPLRGCKASLYEGGIREPFIVRWPGHTPSDMVDDITVISGVDLLPTFCSLAGIEVGEDLKLDGQDMLPALLGTPVERLKPLMWEYRFSPWGRHIQKSPMLAMRDGDWKLMMNPDGSRTELYNLRKNPCEVDNLANENPEVLKQMRAVLMDWHNSLPGLEFIPSDAGSFKYPWPEE
jgi:arylsulfatase A-like enzyme